MHRRALAQLVATGGCYAVFASIACTPPASSAASSDAAAPNGGSTRALPENPSLDDLPPGRVTFSAPGIFSVPLESRLLPIVKCELDDRASRFALLDTGSTGSVISPMQADRMRCERHAMKPSSVSAMLADTRFDTFIRAPQLLIGLMTVRESSLPIVALPMDLDCIFGSEVLSQTALLFETAPPRASFGSAERIETLVEKRFAGAATSAVELSHDDGDKWTMQVESGLGKLKFVVDTGAMKTMLNRAAISTRGLQPVSSKRTFSQDLAGAATSAVEYYRIDALRFGGWTVELEAPGVPSPLLEELHADGALGFDVLGQIPWVFDPEHARIVVVTPNGIESPRLSMAIESGSDLKRMLADPYEQFQMAALKSIATAREKQYLELAGPMLESPHGVVRQLAAYAIRQTIGADWSSESLEAAAIRWWNENGAAPAAK